jgi:hexokinase
MGKSFEAADGIRGQDLGGLVMQACNKRVRSTDFSAPGGLSEHNANCYISQGLDVRMDCIINDGSATLLSRAYCDPTTRFGLILGTGTNVSVILPVNALHSGKYGSRPQHWHECAERVLVNTEFSMFGKDILPLTKFDRALNEAHRIPDFQPFEYLIGGGYLSEVIRLVLVDAVAKGVIPSMRPEQSEPYSLSTQALAMIERCVSLFVGSRRGPELIPNPNISQRGDRL